MENGADPRFCLPFGTAMLFGPGLIRTFLAPLLLGCIPVWVSGCASDTEYERYTEQVAALRQEYRGGHMPTTEYCERLYALEAAHERHVQQEEFDRRTERMMKEAEKRNEPRRREGQHEDN